MDSRLRGNDGKRGKNDREGIGNSEGNRNDARKMKLMTGCLMLDRENS
jgi:hypothetical protein